MIVRLTEAADPAAALAALEEIFFASSVRTSFASDAERSAFLRTWTGWYVTHAPHDVLFQRDEDGRIAGYLTGCRDSAAAAELFRTIPKYDAFADLFPRFPAHLHVNVRPDRRGTGVGAALVEAFAADCRAEGRPGVHVVTGAGARNVPFYARNGFTEAVERGPLLFLGRVL
ncbi:GNAT family N-acetyltransferase [Azospirillum sp.]|uniref:GNAT family N-acetyltransferase n=1 Tax=Azospirillum sp. TaxID=34012 RepID=UPI002D5606BE|nr:GNAT family N-acetyltransferase [Azospirillum sp.]HYD69674.1 GNAT family N-acetyltransferase [Azospirillum sp.]